jgi:hypothetical protein
MSDSPVTECPTLAPPENSTPIIRIPRAAQARLLMHDREINPSFMEVLDAVLPDEAARQVYLNHLAWQARS